MNSESVCRDMLTQSAVMTGKQMACFKNFLFLYVFTGMFGLENGNMCNLLEI